MHLLYLDASGHPHDPSTQFFVLASFAVFEPLRAAGYDLTASRASERAWAILG